MHGGTVFILSTIGSFGQEAAQQSGDQLHSNAMPVGLFSRQGTLVASNVQGLDLIMCTSSSHGCPQGKESTQPASTSATDNSANAASSSPSSATSVSEMKERGNCLLKEGKFKGAVKAYTSALQSAALEQLDDQQKAVLLSNRSLAYVKTHLNAKVYSNCRLMVCKHGCIVPRKIVDCCHETKDVIMQIRLAG